MLRAIVPLLALTSPVLAQYFEGSLANRPRSLDRPISTGLVVPELPDEALIDREAWLREPIPEEELSRQRAGFRRPARGTVWREPITLPSEEPLYDNELAVRNTIQRMQGLWRVQTLLTDGDVFASPAFVGLNYKITDTLVEMSGTSESMWRTPGIFTPSRLQTALEAAAQKRFAQSQFDSVLRHTPEYRESWAGTTARDRQAGDVMNKDPYELEALRLNLAFRGRGQAIAYSWDRYGESNDPHNLLNRPSERVVLSSLGALEVYEDRIMVAVRGIGIRGMLPDHLRLPLGEVRRMFLRIGRDERVTNSYNWAPPVGATTGDLARLIGLEPLEQPTVIYPEPPTGKWVVQPPTRLDFTVPPPKNVLSQETTDKPADQRKNIIPQMHRVALTNNSK